MKAYKFRIYPSPEQEQKLIGWLGQLRFVWNTLLAENKEKYEKEKKFKFKFEMASQLPQMKKDNPWIDAPSQSLQNRLYDLDSAMKGSFRQKKGFPKFKSKHTDNSGIQIPQTNKHIKWDERTITIPKMGKVKWTYHRRIKGRLLFVTIKRDVDQWYVCCLTTQGEPNPLLIKPRFDENDCIGLDLGLKDFFVSSDGEVAPTPKIYRNKQAKLKTRQQRLSKKQKGSKNRNKARIKVARLHRTIRNTRLDWHHKLSSSIVKNYKVVLVEDLNIKGMIKNKNLAKSISDQGWYQFLLQLEYKLKWNGRIFHKIDRWAASTKTCSCCGSKKTITLSERTYICSNCDNVMDRDLNAAINIKNWGINNINTAGTAGIYACGDTADKGIVYTIPGQVSLEAGINPSSEGCCLSSDNQ